MSRAHRHSDRIRSADPEAILLRTAMSTNAWFSALSGAVLVVGAPVLSGVFGVGPLMLALVGVMLVGYGVALAVSARSDSRRILGGRVAVAADVGWIVGAVGLIAGSDLLTVKGEIVLGLVSVVVIGFAAVQAAALRRAGG